MIYCHGAKISGIVYYVTCCYAAEISSVGWGGVGWGGVGGHVNVPCTSYMIYCHAAKISGIAYDVTCCYAAEISSVGWGGVGWGGGGHVNVPCTSYMLLFVKKVTRNRQNLSCHTGTIDSMWNLMKKSIPSNLSAKSDLLMVYARAWQWRCIHKNADCQLFTTHALQR